MIPLLEVPITEWWCPACKATSQTRQAQPHVRMHSCAALLGMSLPMRPAGQRAKIVRHDREDYVGRELVQRDPAGRPIMSITTEYEDGRQDVRVYAPTATAVGGTGG